MGSPETICLLSSLLTIVYVDSIRMTHTNTNQIILQRLVYWDTDSNKAPLRLEHDNIFASVESAYLGLHRPKHSENFVERTMRVSPIPSHYITLVTNQLTLVTKRSNGSYWSKPHSRTPLCLLPETDLSLQAAAWAHPFLTAGVVVGFLAGALWMLRRLLDDDVPTGSYHSHHQWKPSRRLD